jgi:hypothetical protein
MDETRSVVNLDRMIILNKFKDMSNDIWNILVKNTHRQVRDRSPTGWVTRSKVQQHHIPPAVHAALRMPNFLSAVVCFAGKPRNEFD